MQKYKVLTTNYKVCMSFETFSEFTNFDNAVTKNIYIAATLISLEYAFDKFKAYPNDENLQNLTEIANSYNHLQTVMTIGVNHD